MPTVDLAQIQERLYEDPQVVAKLAADYGLSQPPGDPNELATALTDAFGQQPDATRRLIGRLRLCSNNPERR